MRVVGREVGQRLQHEGVLQLDTRNLQVAGTVERQVVVEDDVDVERTRAEARTAAIATMGVFECVQPVVQRERVEVSCR
jgi:hypothetical protein